MRLTHEDNHPTNSMIKKLFTMGKFYHGEIFDDLINEEVRFQNCQPMLIRELCCCINPLQDVRPKSVNLIDSLIAIAIAINNTV